jgi:hypothetical protein
MSQGQFHINSNGDVMPCKATKNRCQFGDGTLHFEDAKEARGFVEDIYSKGFYKDVLRGKKSNVAELLTKPKTPAAPKTMVQEEPSVVIELESASKDSITWQKRFLRKDKAIELKIKNQSYPVLYDDTKSGFLCTDCGKQLSPDNEAAILSYESSQCACGAYTSGPEDQPIGVFAKNLWLLEPSTYEHNRLYHLTKRPNWLEDIKEETDLKIHMGTEEASAMRRHDLELQSANFKDKWYQFSVKFKKSDSMKVLLSEDLEDSWDRISADGAFVIYLNRWEQPGSLSVMTTQEFMEINPVAKN